MSLRTSSPSWNSRALASVILSHPARRLDKFIQALRRSARVRRQMRGRIHLEKRRFIRSCECCAFLISRLTFLYVTNPHVRKDNVPQDNSAMNAAHRMGRYRSALEHAPSSCMQLAGIWGRAVDGGVHACFRPFRRLTSIASKPTFCEAFWTGKHEATPFQHASREYRRRQQRGAAARALIVIVLLGHSAARQR